VRIEVSGKAFVGLLLAGLAVWGLQRLWGVVLLVLFSFILMAALLPLVELSARRKVPRAAAVLGILVGLLVIVAGMFATVAPAMFDQVQRLRDNLPNYAAEAEQLASDLGFDTSEWELERRAEEIDWTQLVSGRLALDYGQRVVYAFFSTVTVIVLTAYLLMDAPRLRRFVFRFIPAEREPEARHFLQELGRVVGGYVRGQLFTSAVIGIYTTVVLAAAGVPDPIAFGIVAAFADVIPIVGAFIAIVPATLAAFQESVTQAIVVLAALLAYQQFEDRFLVPKVYSRTLNVPPLVVLLAVLIGGELLGIAGVLLALPAAAAGRVVLDYYYPPEEPERADEHLGAQREVAESDQPRPEPTLEPRVE